MSEETQNGLIQGEGQQPVAEPTTQEPQVDEEQEALANSKNPERTAAYINKLKQQLKEKEAAIPPKPSLLETYATHQQPVISAPVQEQKKAVYDEQGYVDVNELDKRLAAADEAQKRAEEAKAKADAALEKIARFEIDNETKALYKEFPELDPSNKDFNPDFYEDTKNTMLGQLVDTGKQNALEAAKKVSRHYKKVEPQVTEAQQQRTFATSTYSSGSKTSSTEDFDDLRKRSLTDDAAMEERIRRLG